METYLYKLHETCYYKLERKCVAVLGKRMATLRKQMGRSQKDVSKALGISASAVGMYEQGRREPPAELLVAFARLYGVSVDYLLTGKPEESGGEEVWAKEMAQALSGAHLEDDQGNRRPVTENDTALLASALSGEDAEMMAQALALAEEAAADGEVPVGCVVVRDGQVVGRGRNRRQKGRNALAHAELEAIDEACRTLGGWRLWQCTLYVTLEPCPMCAGAILNARIPRVVYGAKDPKAGSCGSVCDLFAMSYNHHPRAEQGLMEEACGRALQNFFRDLRRRKGEENR